MKNQTNQPTTTATAPNLAEIIKHWQKQPQPQSKLAPLPKPKQKTRAERQEETRTRLAELTEKRNALLTALKQSQTVRKEFAETVHTLCETVAQISVYKTLNLLVDAETESENVRKCEEMLFSFSNDMRLYRTANEIENYSDAMDLFIIAYMEIWQFLSTSAPLTLADTVRTKVLKNGTEKNSYAIFCKKKLLNKQNKKLNYLCFNV